MDVDFPIEDADYTWYEFNFSASYNLSHYLQTHNSASTPSLVINVEFLISVIFYSLMLLVGITGNTLVIFCVGRYKRMQSVTNQLLLSLACADLLLTIFCVPLKFAKLFSFGWTFGVVLCKGTHYIQVCSMACSVLTLTAISLERYYAISKPLKVKYTCTKKHIRVVILSIWVSSFLLSIPTLFVQSHYSVGMVDKIYWCDKQWDQKGSLIAIGYESYMLFLLFLLPVFVMICAYGGLCVELWAVTRATSDIKSLSSKPLCCNTREITTDKSEKIDSDQITSTRINRRGHNSCSFKSHQRENQIRKQVVKMLITVVVLFIICWGPYLFYNIILATGSVKPYLPLQYPYAKPLNIAFSLLAFTNSCVNPLVYGFMSHYFRKSFKQALTLCFSNGRGHWSGYVRTPKGLNQGKSITTSLKRYGVHDLNSGLSNKRSATISTFMASSTLSNSPPISPMSTCQRLPEAPKIRPRWAPDPLRSRYHLQQDPMTSNGCSCHQ